MSEKPKCPYCGDKMILHILTHRCHATLTSAWYQCVTCDSESPHIEFPGDMANDKIIERLQAVSSRRVVPKNRVLTLDEIREIEDHNQDNRALIWIESQSQINLSEYDLAQGSIQYINGNEFSFVYLDWEGNDIYRAETYKKTWRCWLRKPTNAERRETPWEGDSRE